MGKSLFGEIHMKIDYKKQGKKNRESGQRFEVRVRKDLEKDGWIVDRWSNNVSDYPESNINLPLEERKDRKLVPAKSRFGMRTTGFPDFIAFRTRILSNINSKEMPNILYEIIGVECKSNGSLDKTEKEKCKWLVKNKIFSKIIIVSKGKKRGKIVYKEFGS